MSDSTEAEIFNAFTLDKAYRKRIETAGHAYQDFICEVNFGKKKRKKKAKKEGKEKEELKQEFYDFSKKREKKEDKPKTKEEEMMELVMGENLYEILGKQSKDIFITFRRY